MSTSAQREPESVATTEERYRLVARRDEIVHLVCCRDATWTRAFCGAEEIEINPAAEVACAMCLDEVEAMRPGWRSEEEWVCPVDGARCPDLHEVDLRIARTTDLSD